METEVYSWRVSSELKSNLERAARQRNTTVADALRQAATAWMQPDGASADAEADQRRIRTAVEACAGTLSGLPGSENVSSFVKEKLRRRYAR